MPSHDYTITVVEVEVGVYNGDSEVAISCDGELLDEIDRSKQTFLRVIFPEKGAEGVNVFTIEDIWPDGKGKGKKRLIHLLEDSDDGYADVPVVVEKNLTRFPKNHFRILSTSADGRVEHYEVSLTIHGGRFYLFTQLTEKLQVYRTDHQVVCPRWSEWQAMRELLDMVYGDNLDQLPHLPAKLPQSKVALNGCQGQEGIVDWYNVAMGRGYITTPRGNLLVRTQNIAGSSGMRFLEAGMHVSYTHTGKVGRQFEARGVKVKK